MDERQESVRPRPASGWNKRVIVIVVLALLGAWISLNLHNLHLSGGQGRPGVFRTVCEMGGGGCDQVLQSSWANLPRQIPTAFAGLIYFSVIALWYLVVGRANRAGRSWYVPIFALQILGALFSLFLLGVMLFQIGALCGWCALAHVINFVLLGFAWKLWPRESRAADEPAWPPARLGVAALLLSLVIAAFWNERLLVRYLQSEVQRFHGDTDLMRYLHVRNSPQEIPLRADDPVRGSGGALHTIVVFSDFQCPSCRGFAAFIRDEIQPLYGDRLRLVFKHFPLDSDCNPPQRTLHPSACEAAYAAEAARELGGAQGFWKMHDVLFERVADVAAGRWAELATSAGLDGAAIAGRVARRSHLDRVQQDVQLASDLKVRGTPAIFIDGRYLEDWTRLELWKAILGPPVSPQAAVAADIPSAAP